jgi:hypothetical protein
MSNGQPGFAKLVMRMNLPCFMRQKSLAESYFGQQ